MLAVATSIDALAVGVSFAFLGMKNWQTILSPVGIIGYKDKVMEINNNKMGRITEWLYDRLTGIQTERYPNSYNWVVEIAKA